jgi:hypothetical protein
MKRLQETINWCWFILSTRHFANLPLCQPLIDSTWPNLHLVLLPSPLTYILFPYCAAFCQVDKMSCWRNDAAPIIKSLCKEMLMLSLSLQERSDCFNETKRQLTQLFFKKVTVETKVTQLFG